MLKIRLKRLGAKKAPTYRIIVINSTIKREGKPIEELGHYNPKSKEMKLNLASAEAWVKKGAQPTDTVKYLLAKLIASGFFLFLSTGITPKLLKKYFLIPLNNSILDKKWIHLLVVDISNKGSK